MTGSKSAIASQLVRVFDSSPTFPTFPMAPAKFVDHREALGDDGEVAVYMRDDVELASERSERLHAMVASAGFFHLLRHDLVLGRDFKRGDERGAVGRPTIRGRGSSRPGGSPECRADGLPGRGRRTTSRRRRAMPSVVENAALRATSCGS